MPKMRNHTDLVNALRAGLCQRTMPREASWPADPRDKQTAAEQGFNGKRMALLAVEYGRAIGMPEPVHAADAFDRMLSSGAAESIFGAPIGSSVVHGFFDEPDPSPLIAREITGVDFRKADAPVAILDSAPKRIAPGGKAEHFKIDAFNEPASIVRYAETGTIDDQDLVDDKTELLSSIPEEIGRQCRRLPMSLICATLLRNAEMSDGENLFATNHFNTLEDTLTATTYQRAVNLLMAQRERFPGLRSRPSVLLIPPALTVAASAIVDAIQARNNVPDHQRITIVVDDRVSSRGLIDPDTGDALTGSDAGWYLFAAPSSAPTFMVSYLENKEPSVRVKPMRRGRYGLHYDVKHDVGVTPLHYVGVVRGGIAVA